MFYRVFSSAIIAVCLVGLMRPAEAQLAEYGLSAAQLAALEEGETVVVKLEPPNNAGVRVQAFRKMPVAPQSLRPVFTDCDRFVDFMPRTLKSKMTERTSNTSVCEMVVDMPFPFDDLWSVVRVKWGCFCSLSDQHFPGRSRLRSCCPTCWSSPPGAAWRRWSTPMTGLAAM